MRVYSFMKGGVAVLVGTVLGAPALGQQPATPYPAYATGPVAAPVYQAPPTGYAPAMQPPVAQQPPVQQSPVQRAPMQQAPMQQVQAQQAQVQPFARPTYTPAAGQLPAYASAVAPYQQPTPYQQPSAATQQPSVAVPAPANRVAMMQNGAPLPAPTESIGPAPTNQPTAVGPVTPGPMSATTVSAGPMGPQPNATMPAATMPAATMPAATMPAAPAVASYPAVAGADCGCGPAQPAASWEGYMPATSSAGCATGDCGAAPYACGTDACYPATDCGIEYCDAGPRRQWFAGFYGLYMGRDNPGKATSAFLVDGAPAGTYYPQPGTDVFFTTSEADVDFTGGGEVRLGSTFGCATDPCGCGTYQPFAWEVAYWGLAEDSSFGELSDDDFAGTDRIYGAINYAGLEFDRDGAGGGTYGWRPLNDYYDYQAPIDSTSTNDLRVLAVRVRQTFQVQNIELNFWRFGAPGVGVAAGGCGSGVGGGLGSGMLRNAMAGGRASCGTAACGAGCGPAGGPACGYDACGTACGCGPVVKPQRFFISGLAGVRYFRLDETFRNSVFFASAADPTYGGSMPTAGTGSDQVIFHDVEVDNDLVGFQLGCSMNCLVGCRWTLFADTNFGIYGNQIDAYQRVFNPAGTGEVRFVGTGGDAAVRRSKEDVAFLGEARLGVGYQLSPRCRLTSAYRVIAVSGVALAPSQINPAINESSFGHIDSNDSIVIHGLQAGVEFKY